MSLSSFCSFLNKQFKENIIAYSIQTLYFPCLCAFSILLLLFPLKTLFLSYFFLSLTVYILFLFFLSLCHFSNMLWPVKRPLCLICSYCLSLTFSVCMSKIPKSAMQHSVLLSPQAAAERSFFTKACVRGYRNLPCSLAHVHCDKGTRFDIGDSVLYYSPQWAAWTMKLSLAPFFVCLEPFSI